MGTLIWIIIFVIIIASAVRNSSARKRQRKPGDSEPVRPVNPPKAKPNQQPPYAKQAKPNKPKPGTRTAKPNKPKPGTRTAKPNQAKPNRPDPGMVQAGADKARYEAYKAAKQGTAQTAASAFHQMHVDDILESARENNLSVQIDNDMDTIEIGDLMAKVEENIVKGPADTLSFQRDFIAEGMDLLNSYTTIPGTTLQ
ncbi:MAG: hypothetical protein LUE90_06350 [Clostridiales bacterium]|nr:hypothetical protein [Clostridiales bacterium]